MKRIIIIIGLLIPVIMNAQESQLNAFFDKYSGKDGYTSVYITKFMFELFAKIDNDSEDKEFKEATSKLTAIKILTVDSVKNANAQIKFKNELMSVLPKTIYKELMIVKDGSETITFLINEQNSKISEFVMTVEGGGDPCLIFLEGDINLKSISKLSKTMNVKGFEHLDKVE